MQIEKAYKLLTSSHETLKIKFDEEVEDWRPDKPPPTTMMSCLAEVLLSQESDFTDDQYQSIFLLVEELLLNYDDEVKNAVATGLLETLVNASNQQIPSKFTFFIGDEAKKYCIAWDDFTGIKTLGLY